MIRQLATLLVLTGCGTAFVEPNPPQLGILWHHFQAPVDEEPVVYGFIFDLNLPTQAACDETVARLTTEVGATLLPAGRKGLALAPVFLAPDCHQSLYRALDEDAVVHAVADAERALAPGRVRAIFVYVNNIDLDLPPAVTLGLDRLRERLVGRGGYTPQFWGLAVPRPLAGYAFDRVFTWTFGADPTLLDELFATANAELPYRSQVWSIVKPVPLFTPEMLDLVRAFKVCEASDAIEPRDFDQSHAAVPVNPRRAPTYRPLLEDVFAQAKDAFVAQTVSLPLELCTASCDRYLDGEDVPHVVWEKTRGCVGELSRSRR